VSNDGDVFDTTGKEDDERGTEFALLSNAFEYERTGIVEI
jgi:hypothetical protein